MQFLMIVSESLLVSTVQGKSFPACHHNDHHHHHQDHHPHLVEGGGPMQGKPTLAGHHQTLTHLPALTLTAHLNIIIDIVVINMMIIDMMIFIKMFILDSYP